MSLLHVWHSLDYFFFRRICEKCVTRQQKHSNKRRTLLRFSWCIVTCCRRTSKVRINYRANTKQVSCNIYNEAWKRRPLFVLLSWSLWKHMVKVVCCGGYRSAKQYMFRWGVNTTENSRRIKANRRRSSKSSLRTSSSLLVAMWEY